MIKNIIVSTDLSARSDRAVLRAIKIANNYDAHLTILHVVDSQMPDAVATNMENIATEKINACISGAVEGIEYDIKIIHGHEYIDILTYATQNKYDLIILGTHRHTVNELNLTGKTIERVIQHSKIPVLIVEGRSESDYDSIIVGIDFNIHSKKSLKFVLNCFENSNFSLVHSFQTPFSAFLNDDVVRNQAFEEQRDELENFMKQNIEDVSKYNVKQVIREGGIKEILNEEISATQPDLLVLGTHGRTGISHALRGSVTESFLIDPPCDILVIRA